MPEKILVIGGTGLLGQPVARSLNEAGFQVRVMTRAPQRARELFDDSFDIFAGDPRDTNCLEEALYGCQGVHISLPSGAEQTAAEAVARVAPRHGVERITYISGATVAEENRWCPMVNEKLLAEEAIRETGIPYTFFCPTWFMESLPLFVRQGRAAVLGQQPWPYHWLAADDYARMVATSFLQPAAESQRIVVHGPEAIRMAEALRRYSAVLQPEIKQVSTMPLWLVTLLAIVTRDQELKAAGELMGYFEKVGEGSRPATVDSLFAAPATTLDMWLESRRAQAQPRAEAHREPVAA